MPITFAPTGTGPIAATLTAETTSGKTATFELSGTGQAVAALLEATPPAVTFGGTTIGGHLSGSATFRNVGGQPLTIESVREPVAPFSAVGLPKVGSTIAPGGSVTVTVSFDPTSKGVFSDEIGLDTTGGSSSVGLSGSADEPGRLEIESESTGYGPIPLGTSVTRAFTIKNAGATAVTVTKSKPPIGGAFTAVTSLPEGTTIAAGESLNEEVSFAPTVLGEASGEWVINGDDASGLHKVLFQGRGVEARSPMAATGAASGVTQTAATLNASVNPAGETLSDCRFEYGPTSAYGASAPCSTVPSPGETPVAVSATITGLAPNSTYYYRVRATNATATAHGDGARLTTLPLLLAPSPLGGATLQVLSAPIVSAAVPRLKLLRNTLVAGRSGTVAVTLSCISAQSRCVGRLILRTQIVAAGSGARGRLHKPVTLAAENFSLGAGRLRTLHLHLSASALKLLLRLHLLRAQATITADNSLDAIHPTRQNVTVAAGKSRK